MASAIEMTVPHRVLSETLKSVRTRWRLKILLRSIMVIMGGALLAALVGAWIMELYRFAPAVVTSVRIGFYVILAGLLWWYCIRPLVRRVDDKQVALYLEENEPSLETTVLSAVEVGTQEGSASLRSSRLFSRIVDMAVTRAHAINGGARVEKRSMITSLSVIAGTCMIGALVLHFGPEFLRAGARLLLTPWSDIQSVSPYVIDVYPGDTTVARGGDQTIRVRLKGFHAQEVDLSVQRNAQGVWERLPMSATQEADVFEIRLLDLEERTAYYVEAHDVRSPQYHLDVVDRPAVRTVSLEYRYPKYTGMATAWVENGGDIAAPIGTSVIVRAKTTMPVTAGQIAIEGQPSIPMTLDADGTLTGTIVVRERGFYKIELEAAGSFIAGTVPYTIEAIEDRIPTIVFRKPGRDLPVNTTDKVFSQIEATDDYGVVAVELTYSVNGGTERRVELYSTSNRQTSVVVDHTFLLEKIGVKPGDFVSYYANTVDNDSSLGKVAKTDMYFLHVRSPEDEKDLQQDEESDENESGLHTLSKLQQDIITRTFQAERDKPNRTPDEHREHVTTITRSQSELSERINKLVEQLKERGIESFDSVYREITKDLAEAVDEMRAATQQLANQNLTQALQHEQRALRDLQRAETLFQKRRKLPADSTSVYFKSYEPTTKDLDDLFDADDGSPPQDAAKRAAQDTADNKVAELIEQIKKITAEQKQENQRRQQRAAQPQQQSSDGGQTQRQLAYETEQLARRLKRDANDNGSDYTLGTSQVELEEAAKRMQLIAVNVGGAGQGDTVIQHLDRAREILEKRQERRGEQKKQQQDKKNQQKDQQQSQQASQQKNQQQKDKQQEQQGQEKNGQQGNQAVERARQVIRDTEKLGMGVADFSRLPKKYAEQRNALEKLQEKLKQQGLKTGELEQTIKEIRALENAQTYKDPETVKKLRESIVSGLKQWELSIRRQTATKQALHPVTGGSADVPDGFKSLVAEYYRSLAKHRETTEK